MPSTRIPDAGHPLVEQFAEHMYCTTPEANWPAPFTGRTGVWEREPPELRTAFRDRARRFMAGDLSVAPWAS